MLRTFEMQDRDLDPVDPWGEFLQSCAFGIRSTHHTTLQASPGQLVFGRDMIHNIPFIADWSNDHENTKRLLHKYNEGNQVLLYKPGIPHKLSTPKEGPYVILKVHTNGTVKIQCRIIEETVNLIRLEPFFE